MKFWKIVNKHYLCNCYIISRYKLRVHTIRNLMNKMNYFCVSRCVLLYFLLHITREKEERVRVKILICSWLALNHHLTLVFSNTFSNVSLSCMRFIFHLEKKLIKTLQNKRIFCVSYMSLPKIMPYFSNACLFSYYPFAF